MHPALKLFIFITIFCLPRSAIARLSDSASSARPTCTTVKSPSGNVVSIDVAISECKEVIRAFDCEEMAKTSPLVHVHPLKCDAESLCKMTKVGASYSTYLYGAWSGFTDGMKFTGHLFADAIYGAPKELMEICRKCDAVSACKRGVAEQIAWRKNSSEADLQSVSTLRLATESLVSSGLEKLKAATGTVTHCLLHPIDSIPTEEQAAKNRAAVMAKLRDFVNWLQATTRRNLIRKANCVDADGMAELQAYTFGMAMDPLAYIGSVRSLAAAAETVKGGELAAESLRLSTGGVSRTAAEEAAAETAERRKGLPTKPVSRTEPRTPARGSFIEENLNYSPATPEMNEAFVKIAERETGQGSTRFYDVENSLIKPLNDKTNDKNLVTAMTNYHKRLLLDELKELEKRNPGLEVTLYSDFKAVRFAASGSVPRDIDHQVQELLKKVNQVFAEKIKGADLIRHSDPEFKIPERWFRAGSGPTADQANLSARLAREQKTPNQMLNFDSPQMQADVSRRLTKVDSLRADVARALGGTPLLEAIPGTSKTTLNREAFDLTRKYPSAEALRDAIRKRYGKPSFSTEQAGKMLGYAKATDEFSPGIHVTKREIVNLDSAEHGGFSADFLGLGSSNQRGTAEALARARDLKDALLQTRRAEKDVTTEFKARVQRFKEIAGDFVRCSGDDCVGIAEKPMTIAEKRELLKRLAADDKTRGIRLSFVSEGVPVPADRTTLSTHGESIEKILRKKLEGDVQHKRLQKAIFAIDMKTQKVNGGPVNLVVSNQNGLLWTQDEWEAIEKAFAAAVKAHNASLEKEGISAAYKAVHSSCDAIAGAAACAAPMYH